MLKGQINRKRKSLPGLHKDLGLGPTIAGYGLSCLGLEERGNAIYLFTLGQPERHNSSPQPTDSWEYRHIPPFLNQVYVNK